MQVIVDSTLYILEKKLETLRNFYKIIESQELQPMIKIFYEHRGHSPFRICLSKRGFGAQRCAYSQKGPSSFIASIFSSLTLKNYVRMHLSLTCIF